MGEYNWLKTKFTVQNFKKIKFIISGLGVSNMKKEYTLKIIYDPKNDEIEHLSESEKDTFRFYIEVNGEDMPITEEMGNYLMEHTDSSDIGIS